MPWLLGLLALLLFSPVQAQEVAAQAPTHAGWFSLLPSVLAIAVALLFRQVVLAMFLGIWMGAWVATGDVALGWWHGLLASLETYIRNGLADADHMAIILFSMMIGGLVGLIQRNGGTQGIVRWVVSWAGSPRRGQLATTVLGVLIFFDDYANSLIVGGTMRPITDRLRISREKLAYIVDSTAAPVACLALITTWIGYQVGLISEAIAKIPNYDEAAYAVFLNSLPYQFYPILAILFVFAVAAMRRDFGPMLEAERRAHTTGQVYRPGAKIGVSHADEHLMEPPEGKPIRAFNAAVPILVLVVAVLAGLYTTGTAAVRESGDAPTLQNIISSANSYQAMLWASLAGVMVAILLSVGQRILTIVEAVDAWFAGVRSMLLALMILAMAWALAGVNDDLGTAAFLTSALADSLPLWVLPALTFVLAAAIAFATGTSWGTMAILMPLVIPLAWGILEAQGLATDYDTSHHTLYAAVAAVLGGAVWGDHCSPVSDTTILSSLASSCDHIDHVRTQMPYALVVGLVTIAGLIPTAMGAAWWAVLPVCAVALLALLRFYGQPVEGAAAVPVTPSSPG